jgi:hypothetical protein
MMEIKIKNRSKQIRRNHNWFIENIVSIMNLLK